MAQVTIYGLVVKSPRGGKGNRKYTDVELSYDVEDDVDLDAIERFMHRRNLRIAPVRESGEKFDPDERVGIEYGEDEDKDYLSTSDFLKELSHDLSELEWKEEKNTGHHKRK